MERFDVDLGERDITYLCKLLNKKKRSLASMVSRQKKANEEGEPKEDTITERAFVDSLLEQLAGVLPEPEPAPEAEVEAEVEAEAEAEG